MKKLTIVFVILAFVNCSKALAAITRCSSECTDYSGEGPYYWIPLSQCLEGYTCYGVPTGSCSESQESEILEGTCVRGSGSYDGDGYSGGSGGNGPGGSH